MTIFFLMVLLPLLPPVQAGQTICSPVHLYLLGIQNKKCVGVGGDDLHVVWRGREIAV